MATGSTAVATSTPTGAQTARTTLIGLTLFSIGHFFIDLYSSSLGVFQPLLIDKLHFSLTEAGLLGGMMSFASSVTQPAFGYLSDRYRSRLFAALAPATAGLFIAALGLASSYWMLFVMVLIGGLGVSAFHPQASSRATVGLRNRARWMAVFISAGTLGLAFGPASFSALFRLVGLEGAFIGAAPGVLTTVLLLALLPAHDRPAGAPRHRFDIRPLAEAWKPLTILYMLVFLRSVVQVSFTQFLPLYLGRERGYSMSDASWALSLYLAAGAIGGFSGGQLADRFGARRIIQISMIGSLPFLLLFFFARGPLSLFGLAAGGLILLFTIPVNVVMAQELVPSQAGTVSALMMGFAWGMAGLLFIPLTGWAADHFSLHNTLLAQMTIPVAGWILTFFLPHENSRLSR
jgi:FSR family fosmidomycin resistance protein-like MFS transporter